eukprot:CAMPEP_0195521958 /NCGR_PEP_ID=MMETSP0794_2-20130614/19766_1 /TAXON_ID=515487 /ORGANISM="Stephanopyxis turris, Strain CCMP 815" /LENGTH=382 /DNA_ID=CAMNT_0040651623 /DNA_START=44 /DNA_END=1192 /DNA_ORIENTATION=-
MSEFEGYQETDASTSEVQYESMSSQPQVEEDPQSPYVADAVPVEGEAEKVEGAAAAVAAAEGKINAIIEKVGKFGLLMGIFVVSLIYTIAAGCACYVPYDGGVAYGCVGIYGYAFATGIISLLLSLAYIIILRYTQILANDGHVGHQVLAWFFFVWWLAGGCAGTFSAPFGTLSNGYFAAWAGIFISGLFLAIVSPIFKSFADKAKSAILVNEAVLDQVGLVIASIIEVIAASMGFGETSSATKFDDYGYNAYGVSVGVVSVIFGTLAIFLVMQSAQNPSFAKFFSWISYFLWGWWLLGFAVMTFRAPFFSVGNGYFACVAALYFTTRVLRTTSMFQSLAARAGRMIGGPVGAAAVTATYAAEEEPQYASSNAYVSEEGMDF